MRRALALLLLALAPAALAAVETTTITGKVLLPDGTGAQGGTIQCDLSQPGSADDGGTAQRIATRVRGSIGSDGAISLALVPNDAITPAGTYYDCRITTSGAYRAAWSERWQIDSTPDPVDIGDVTRLNVAPGITVGDFVEYVDTAPSGACTSAESPKMAVDTGEFCRCLSSTWSCASGSGDMLRSTYDTEPNDVVDAAEALDVDGDGTPDADWNGTALRFTGAAQRARWLVRYIEQDADRDGSTDYVLCGDADGDGTLETADVNACRDLLTDTILADIDGDGTTETLYGTLQLIAGRWSTGTTFPDVPDQSAFVSIIKPMRLLGSGRDATVIVADYSRAELCSAVGIEGVGIVNVQDVSDVEIAGLTLVGIGARSSPITDCDGDGSTNDGPGGVDDNTQYGINFVGTSRPGVDNIIVHDVRVVSVDRIGIHGNLFTDAMVTNFEVSEAGEHAAAFGNYDGLILANGVLRGARSGAQSRGLELAGLDSSETANTIVSNVRLADNSKHVWIFTSSTGAFRNAVFDNLIMEDTDYDDASASNGGVAFLVGGAAGGSGLISDIQLRGSTIRNSQAEAVWLSGATSNIRGVQILDTNITASNTVKKLYVSGSADAGAIRITTSPGTVTGTLISRVTITTDAEPSGVLAYGTGTTIADSKFLGTLDTDGRQSFVYLPSAGTGLVVENSDFDLDGTDGNTLYAISVDGADGARITGNRITFDAGNNKCGVRVNLNSDNLLVRGNSQNGGDNFLCTTNGASAGLVVESNWAAMTYAGDSFSWAFNIGHGTTPRMVRNWCVGVGSSPCFRYNVAGSYGDNVTLSGTAKTGSFFGSRWLTGTCGATACVCLDLDEDGVIESTDTCFLDAGQDANCDGTAD